MRELPQIMYVRSLLAEHTGVGQPVCLRVDSARIKRRSWNKNETITGEKEHGT
jgi:hypothetical protein